MSEEDELTPKPKPTSPAKIAANRRNGALSRGPKTERGKARSRWNALKHGLLARCVVIQEGQAKEDPKLFENMLARLRQELAPVGMLEEMLVEVIAICYWRLQRAVAAEAAEIRKGADGNKQLMKLARARAFDTAKRNLDRKDSSGLSLSSEALEYQQQLLSSMIAQVQASGVPNTVSLGRIVHTFRTDPDNFHLRCYAAAESKDRQLLLTLLRQKEASVSDRLAEIQAMEEAEVELAKTSLPPEPVLNNLLRYETILERRLDKAIAQLDCLQQQRRAAVAASRQATAE